MEKYIKYFGVYTYIYLYGSPHGSVVKNLPASGRDTGLITGWGRYPEGGHDNPL